MAVILRDLGPYLGPVAVAVIAGLFASWSARRSSKVEEAKNRAQDSTSRFAQVQELDEYVNSRVDSAVAKAVEPYERRIAALEEGYGKIARTLRSVRQAFREYIRAVRAQWGHAVEPPAVDAHIRELLAEDDLDGTFDAESIRDIRSDLGK